MISRSNMEIKDSAALARRFRVDYTRYADDMRIMGRISYLSMLRGKEDTYVKRMKAIMSKVAVTK